MKIRMLYSGYLQLVRAKEILFIILKHVLKGWFSSRKAKRKRGAQRQVHTTQERLRIIIEELGPTYIKVGQILADRPDVISESFRNELKKLQSSAKPISDIVALALIESELGCPINEVFAEFDEQCLASASIGQVYKGKLLTGEDVIIKIQRPYIENKIKLDLYLMRYLAKRTLKSYPGLAAMNIIGFIDEFSEGILKELDYNNEASNILRFNEMFNNDATVYVPKVYLDYTSKRLLVMELIKGEAPDDIDQLKQAGLDPKIIAVNGANAILKMVLEHGFFHADPHPGNIFVLPNNVIAFIDFGMTGVLKPRDMNFLADFCLGFAKGDAKSIANAMVTLCGVKFFDRIDELEFELSNLIKSNSYVPFEKMDFANIMQKCINMIVRYDLKIPASIFMLIKALATIQKFAAKLDPDMSLGPVIMPYARQIVMQKYNPKRLAGEIYDTIANYVSLVRTLPTDVSEILYKLKEGKIKHEISLQGNENILRKSGQRLGIIVLTSTLFIGSCILAIWSEEKQFAHIVLFVSGFLIFLLLIKLIIRTKL
jgi:ubiquinone biosynthesis protein